jgi:hypothetical protein
MIDAKALLDRFLGTQGTGTPTAGQSAASPWGAQPPATTRGGGTPLDLGGTAQQVLGRLGGAGGVAAAGGLLAVLLSGKARKKGGGLLSHGGAAVLGALAIAPGRTGRPGSRPPRRRSRARRMRRRWMRASCPVRNPRPMPSPSSSR